MKYVIITPAFNEVENIEKTIKSMISQTVLPAAWVIVSDASNDGTDDIVKKYARQYEWIKYLRLERERDRHFAAKVHCFLAGYNSVKEDNFDIIGNVDADISFDEDHFEFLLNKFESSPSLGVAGTPFVENGFHSYYDSYKNIHHVSGACQIFRRKCFDDIGGYIPIKGGGIDWIAVTTARMKGWQTRQFIEKSFNHHRKMGTGDRNIFRAKYHLGYKDYYLGGHPLFQFFRAFFQMKKRPFVIGGGLILLGYMVSMVKREEIMVSEELMRFHRKEQLKRIKHFLTHIVPL